MHETRQSADFGQSGESLGPTGARDSLFAEVAAATDLREGPKGVEDFLRSLLLKPPGSLKALARQLSWPVPVAAAVRRELERRGYLGRERGLGLSDSGRRLCEDWLPWRGLLRRCPKCDGAGWQVDSKVVASLLPKIEAVCRRRPEVDVTLDQALATPETNLRRSLELISTVGLYGRKVIFLGDDDWTSACLATVLRNTAEGAPGECQIMVIDIDQRIVDGLNRWAGDENFSLEAIRHDLRQAKPDFERFSADVVFTDPPYTEAGLDLFCAWARALLPEDRGTFFLCYPLRDAKSQFQLEGIWRRWGFALQDFRPGWNRYEGGSLHAGQSALWRFEAVECGPGAASAFPVKHSIYTFDYRSSHVRAYRCRQCGWRFWVGKGQRWTTIEALKKAGCENCHAQVFERQESRKAAVDKALGKGSR